MELSKTYKSELTWFEGAWSRFKPGLGKDKRGKSGVDKGRFKKPVIPGDQIILKVELKKSKGGFAVFDASATVSGEVAASAELMCGFKELPEKL